MHIPGVRMKLLFANEPQVSLILQHDGEVLKRQSYMFILLRKILSIRQTEEAEGKHELTQQTVSIPHATERAGRILIFILGYQRHRKGSDKLK